ncbi:MAG: MerR family transcriptional regulator [Acidimicrobiales bacterium]
MTLTDGQSHLSIGEVLVLVQVDFPDVTISKIRFLESQGLIDPERTPSGYRRFFGQDVQRLQWILAQQRDRFLPLKVIKQHLDAGDFDAEADATLFENLEVTVPTSPLAEPGSTEGVRAEAQVELEAEVSESVDSAAVSETSPDDDPMVHDVLMSAARRVLEPKEPSAEPADLAADRAALPEPSASATGPLAEGMSSMSMTLDELASATGLAPAELADLERYGLLKTHTIGPAVYYEGEALVIGRIAAAFLRHGVEARHLRMYKTAADREAGVFEQVIMPFIKQRNSRSRREAREILVEMARLGEALHAAMLRESLRDHTDGA